MVSRVLVVHRARAVCLKLLYVREFFQSEIPKVVSVLWRAEFLPWRTKNVVYACEVIFRVMANFLFCLIDLIFSSRLAANEVIIFRPKTDI